MVALPLITRDTVDELTPATVSYTHINGWSFVNGQIFCGAEPADYSAVEAAMAAIPTDLTVYTDESVAALNTAVDGVVRGKAFVSQANVNAMAQAIQDAIAALQYKDAGKTTPAPAATATPAPTATATPYNVPKTGDTSNPALLVVLMLRCV